MKLLIFEYSKLISSFSCFSFRKNNYQSFIIQSVENVLLQNNSCMTKWVEYGSLIENVPWYLFDEPPPPPPLVDEHVPQEVPPRRLSGNVDHLWNAVISVLLSTVWTALKLLRCIVTNRCLFWHKFHIVSMLPLTVKPSSRQLLLSSGLFSVHNKKQQKNTFHFFISI